jgi:aldehyde dehydrogenase (NAD+)
VGRELGHDGLAEYTQIKSVHVPAATDHRSNFTMKLFSDDQKIPFIQYITPTLVIAGHGALSSIYREVVRLGARRALVLTDAGVRDVGLADLVQQALGQFYAGTFDEIAQDTDLATVDAAVELAREKGADISGSPSREIV